VYVYRSRISNNGAYQITAVGGDYVEISAALLQEEGADADQMALSAAIGRPVIIAHTGPGEAVIRRGFYMQERDFNIMMGLTIRNAGQGFNMQMGGNFNVIFNNVVQNISESNGIQIGVSTAAQPSAYNIIANNVVVDTAVEGMYIGAGGQGPDNNHTDFTHILNNTIYSTPGHKLENAIDLKEYNKGTVVEANDIFNITLMSSGNGAIDVRQEHDDVLIYGNRLENITSDGSLYQPFLKTYSPRRLEVFNNLFFSTAPDDQHGTWLWMSSSLVETAADIRFYNNTACNIPRGLLLNNMSGSLTIDSNIFGNVWEEFATVFEDGAHIELTNNLYTLDPGWTPYAGSSEHGRIIGDAAFYGAGAGDFRLSPTSDAIDAGSTSFAPSRDYALTGRDDEPDIGAWEGAP
jgi:hypothetical protein